MKMKVNTSYHFSGILFGATLHPSGQLHMGAIFFIGTPYLHFVLNCLGYVKTHGFHNGILKTRGVPTKSIISKLLLNLDY